MNITNNYPAMVFRNEENGKVKYTIGISNKKADGTYENASFPIQFNKDVELQDQTKIKIKSAWLSFYNWEYQGKKGKTFFIRCNEFETEGSQQEDTDIYKDFGNSIHLEDNEDLLPF